MNTEEKITLGTMIGNDMIESFENFDLTETQQVLQQLANTDAIDIAHAEKLQQLSLRCADVLIEYVAKLIKTTSYLESKIGSLKNKAALEYKPAGGERITADMRKFASEADPKVEELSILLARVKGAKSLVEKKYDTLLKSHYFYKDVCVGMRKGIVGTNMGSSEKEQSIGW